MTIDTEEWAKALLEYSELHDKTQAEKDETQMAAMPDDIAKLKKDIAFLLEQREIEREDNRCAKQAHAELVAKANPGPKTTKAIAKCIQIFMQSVYDKSRAEGLSKTKAREKAGRDAVMKFPDYTYFKNGVGYATRTLKKKLNDRK